MFRIAVQSFPHKILMNHTPIIYSRNYSALNDPNLRPYEKESSMKLFNSFMVFQLCRIKPLVALTPFFIESSKRFGLSKLFNSLVKATFFRHFCGGETLKEVIPTVENFKASNIGSILDLAMEADLDGKPLFGKEAEVFAANIAVMMNESIDIASAQPGNFIALKVTAFVPPGILQRWTTSLRHFKEVYAKEFQGRRITKSDLGRLMKHFPTFNEKLQEEVFGEADYDKDGLIDWIDLSALITISNPQFAKILSVSGSGDQFVTFHDIETAQLVLKELGKVCEYARTKRVAIMIDAEQTYFQPAIDDIALRLCRKYNVPLDKPDISGMKHAIIYNTYQLYLKDAFDRLVADTLLAKRLKYSFGVKIVRGAYMVSERSYANKLSYSSPINETIEDTHNLFNKACEFLIESVAENPYSPVQPLRFVVASHNKNSINYVYKLLDMHPKVSASDGTVAFAQLMGMQDKTTYGLAAKGVKAYKYIPYGPVEVTIPYLYRRAQENSSVLGGSGEDVENIIKEIGLRIK